MLYAIIKSYLPGEKRILVDSYLVSDLLLISNVEILSLAVASTIAILTLIVFYREFLYLCFDIETAEALGLRAGLYDSLLFATSAVTAAVVARTMGVLLSVTLLVIPAAVSRLATRHINRMLIVSFFIALFSGLCGLALSLSTHIPTSGAIALVSVMLFLITYFTKVLKSRFV
jgi:ABC-type Mn2+/Zn2+ transport system permease subunit